MQLEWNKLEYPRATSMLVCLLVVLVGWLFFLPVLHCSSKAPGHRAVRRKKETFAPFSILFKDAIARNILQKCNFSY